MPHVHHRKFENAAGTGREGSELRPYFFRRDASDVLREALESLIEDVHARAVVPTDAARSATLEQWRATFVSDAAMRALFHDNFDAFCRALEHPEILDEQLRKLREQQPKTLAPSKQWNDLDTPARQWEEDHAAHDHHHHEDGPPSLDDDPTYASAFRWSCRVERWSRRLAAQTAPPDRDLLRISASISLVPTKIAFGFSAAMDDDVSGLEVSVIGYRQAALFLRIVLDALGNCYGKRLGRMPTVHAYLDDGRELLADIEMEIAQLDSEIRYRNRRDDDGDTPHET